MSVGMDVVGVMAAYLPVVRVYTALSREALSLDSAVSTNYIFVHLLDSKVFLLCRFLFEWSLYLCFFFTVEQCTELSSKGKTCKVTSITKKKKGRVI